jgi:L-iditol 2-dehydrogenase
MTKMMKAIVCYGPKDYRLEEMQLPKPGPGEVLIKVGAAGVCGSDIKCYEGSPYLWGDESPYVKPPVVSGHEFVGEVVELGEGAEDKYGLEIGDKAVAEQIVPCWECRFCRDGHYWMCQVHDIFGFQGGIDDGGFAEYAKYPNRSIVHKVPRNMPNKRGAMVEPLACAIHAVKRARIELDDTVVIAGMGPLGLCMLQVAKLKNPRLLVALDIKPFRLSLATELGADLTIDVSKESPVKKIKELTDGYGCDVYIEATGHPSGVIQGLDMIRKLGRFVEFSVHGEPVTIDWSIIGDGKELDVLGSHLGPYCYPLAIEYLQTETVKVDGIVTHQFPLEQYEEAFKTAHHSDDAVKVQLLP